MYKHADDGVKRVYMDWMSCKVDSISSVSALHFSFSATSSSREMLDEQSFANTDASWLVELGVRQVPPTNLTHMGAAPCPRHVKYDARNGMHERLARDTGKKGRRNTTKKRREFSKINFGWERKTKEEKSPVTKESHLGGSIKGYAPSRRSTSFCSFCTDRSANSARVSAYSGKMHSMYNLQARIVFNIKATKFCPSQQTSGCICGQSINRVQKSWT